MVWVYGGSNVIGSGSYVSLDGPALTKKGVVVVTFNYRIGIFGWLAHPELTKESANKTSGNYGLLDMIAALKWVQKNYDAGTIAEMRTKSALDLIRVSPNTMPQTTIVDGYVIPDYLENFYAQGKQIDVPLLTGWNKDEGTIFTPLASKVISYTAAAQTRYGKFADQFLKAYPATTDAEALAQSFASSRDLYGRGIWAWARARVATGKTSTYLYHWTYAPAWLPTVKMPASAPAGDDVSKLGAYHNSEIAYVFQDLGSFADLRKYTDVDYKLSDTLSSYWVNFAKTGDPNGPGLPVWPVFDAKAANPMMYLGTDIKPGPLPNKPGLDFFDAWAGSLLSPAQ